MLLLSFALCLLQDGAPAEAASSERAIRHVIHISVDGLRADILAQLLEEEPERFPSFRRLVAEGSTTFNARTDNPFTVTIPNHATMLTGRPVTPPSEDDDTLHHGYAENVDPSPEATLHTHGNPALDYIASVFDVAHDNGLKTALFASKSKFILFDQSWNEHTGAPDVTGEDDGNDKIDLFLARSLAGTASNLSEDFLAAMAKERFHYAFVHYLDPDMTGHFYGWGGDAWIRAIERVDSYLGALFELLDEDEALRERTALILSSDHGGLDKGHHDPTIPVIFTVPFMVWGPGIARGADLYELSAETRQDPGQVQPDYLAPKQPIRNGDGGNLALQLLGLGPIPGSSINVKQDLVFAADD